MWTMLRRHLRHWIAPHAPESLPVRLDRRRIYILPTASGLFFGLLLAAMLLGALNFNNNPGLLLALLLAGAAQVSLIAAHLQLSGLRVDAVAAEPVPAGTPLCLRIALACNDDRPRVGLCLTIDADTPAPVVHVPLLQRAVTAELPLPTHRRGLLAMPRLRLSTVQPLGLARAWSYVWPQQTLLVYPAPEPYAPPLPMRSRGDGPPHPDRAGEDPHHLREYRPGDARRTIAWKPSARHHQLLVRDAEQPRGAELMLDWQDTAGLPYEHRIRRLARWVDEAEQSGLRYGLHLPGHASIPVGQGAAHRHACLRALAILPLESGHV